MDCGSAGRVRRLVVWVIWGMRWSRGVGVAGVLAGLVALSGASCAWAVGGVYGGLGAVGSALSSGSAGEHGQISPEGPPNEHAFAVDTQTGEFFIADELLVEGEDGPRLFVRLQAFNSQGDFLAENRIKVKERAEEEYSYPDERLGGLAVDPALDRVYLLLDEERVTNKPEVEKALERLERESLKVEREAKPIRNKLTKAQEPGRAKLEEELKALEERLAENAREETTLRGEERALDAEDFSAADLYAFSTKVGAEKLKGKTLVAGSELLASASEVPRAALLAPSGIAVDPSTHDVLILGQQNEAQTSKEGEQLRAAVQRVHEDDTLGPRYVDNADCLDEGDPVTAEPACAEDEAESPASPIVTAGGRVYAQVGEEVWEIPALEDREGGSQDIDVTPKFLYSLAGETFYPGEGESNLVTGTYPEEEGGTLSYAAASAGEGTIFMRAQLPAIGENGVMLYHYTESGESGAPQAREIGWTGGAGEGSGQPNCRVPGGFYQQPLLAAAGGEEAMMLSYAQGRVMRFGPNGEGCGAQPTITPPTAQVEHSVDTSEARVGEPVTLSSKLEGARAKRVKWKFSFRNPVTDETGEENEITTAYDIQKTSLLEHRFEHEGVYEITETAETDSLAHPTITAEATKLTITAALDAAFEFPRALIAEQPATIEARVEDEAETPLHLQAVWTFGDGTQPVTQSYETTGPTLLTIEHTYTQPGEYQVTVELQDAHGDHKTLATTVLVAESE